MVEFTVAVDNYDRFMGRYAIGLAPVVLILVALPLWWVLSVAREPNNENPLFRNTAVSIKVAD